MTDNYHKSKKCSRCGRIHSSSDDDSDYRKNRRSSSTRRKDRRSRCKHSCPTIVINCVNCEKSKNGSGRDENGSSGLELTPDTSNAPISPADQGLGPPGLGGNPVGPPDTVPPVVGPTGPTGLQGQDGPTGSQGQDGQNGLPGPQGDTGPTGVNGLLGPTGPQGQVGQDGMDGLPGPTGPKCTGPTGSQGVTGPTGVVDPAITTFVACFGPQDPPIIVLSSGGGTEIASTSGDTQSENLLTPSQPSTPSIATLANCTLGEIVLFAGSFAPRDTAVCHGQLLPISGNTGLFAVLGTTYGGDGDVTFALPDLRGLEPKGIHYYICITGSFPTPT